MFTIEFSSKSDFKDFQFSDINLESVSKEFQKHSWQNGENWFV